MNPVVSIIVPIYSAESFLHRCVDSVVAQSWKDWELILVDDGSPDNSGAICDEYSRRDKRIKTYHKTNGGVSSARNLGLEHVSGKWVTFLDSDDEIRSEFLECFIKGTTNNEFQFAFLTEYSTCYQGRTDDICVGRPDFWDLPNFPSFLKQYVDDPILKAVHSNFFLWEILRKEGLRFNTKVRSGEDHLFVMEYLIFVNAVKAVQGRGYIYYLPYNYVLKYSPKLKEIEYKHSLTENALSRLEQRFNINLSEYKKTKWRHALSCVDIFKLYDKDIFSQFKHLYKIKIGSGYESDAVCNRESRAAGTLLQIVGMKQHEKQFKSLLSLLCKNLNKAEYKTKSFPLTSRIALMFAQTHSKLLLKIYLLAAHEYIKN